jgi:hypothetical protein
MPVLGHLSQTQKRDLFGNIWIETRPNSRIFVRQTNLLEYNRFSKGRTPVKLGVLRQIKVLRGK